MDRLDSMWDAYLKKGLSRRSFIKGCVALTTMMGLTTDMLQQVVEAAEKNSLPVVVWLHGHECTGCDESFIRSGTPLASDVVLNTIALEYSHVLSASAGEPFEHHFQEIIQQYNGKYILAVEGAVATADNGVYCMSGGRPFTSLLKEAAKGAAAIIEYGSCATSGGIQAAKPNPTGSVGVSSIVGSGKPIIRVPGCPPIPEVMTGVIMHYALFGKLPPLDSENRPTQFYGNRIHDTCYRRPFFDSGKFAERFDDAGSKAGWCLYKLGCRGPVTYNSCGNLRWWNGLSYPIQSGHGCIGCSNDHFWDNDPFYTRLPEYGPLGDVDKIGAAVGGLTAAGVVAHGAMSVVQKKKRQAAEKKSEGKQVDE